MYTLLEYVDLRHATLLEYTAFSQYVVLRHATLLEYIAFSQYVVLLGYVFLG